MKKQLLGVAFVLVLWGVCAGLSGVADRYQKGLRLEKVSVITEKLRKDPFLRQNETVLASLVSTLPMVANNPDLLRSYEVMLTLPDQGRSLWVQEISLSVASHADFRPFSPLVLPPPHPGPLPQRGEGISGDRLLSD